MNPSSATVITSVKNKVTAEEWQTRVDLAACYRLVAQYGWDDLIFTHITAKIPGVENQFLINPYGMMFAEISASSLVKIDLGGNKLDTDNPFPVNPAGFTIHSAIHAARDDAGDVDAALGVGTANVMLDRRVLGVSVLEAHIDLLVEDRRENGINR